jgi:hypothetical protein
MPDGRYGVWPAFESLSHLRLTFFPGGQTPRGSLHSGLRMPSYRAFLGGIPPDPPWLASLELWYAFVCLRHYSLRMFSQGSDGAVPVSARRAKREYGGLGEGSPRRYHDFTKAPAKRDQWGLRVSNMWLAIRHPTGHTKARTKRATGGLGAVPQERRR